MKHGRRAVAGAFAFVALSACANPKRVPPASAIVSDRFAPRWEDAFDRTPEMVVFVRSQEMRHDKVYGPFLKTLLELARAHAPAGVGARATEAFESADELIVGMLGNRGLVVVVRGVRPDIDPEKLTDARGEPIWAPDPSHARTPELVHERPQEVAASLFILPERTWVLAVGNARDLARDAFASSVRRSWPPRDERALVLLRLDGGVLVDHVPRLTAAGSPLAALGHDLSSVTVALGPGDEGVLATLAYSQENAAAASEATLRRVLDVMTREKTPRASWFAGTKITREGQNVRATIHLPPGLLRDLATATPADLAF